MADILEQPEIRRFVSSMSVETYHHLAGLGPDTQPTELIRGIVIDKADKVSRSQLHIHLVRALFRLVQLATQGLEVFVTKEDPLTLAAANSEPEPDIAVISGRQEDYRVAAITTALLIIEVAVTSLALDREKANLYAEAGVPEYWIVLAQRGEIDVYTALVGGSYTQRRTYRHGETVHSVALPSLHVDLDALFVS